MTQRPDNANPLDPFGTLRTLRDANVEAWSKALQQFVNTDAYSQATGALLDAYLTNSAPFRKAIEQTMTQVLQVYNMPTQADVISIAERLTNIETRLDDLDAQLGDMRRATQRQATPQPALPSTGLVVPTPEPGSAADLVLPTSHYEHEATADQVLPSDGEAAATAATMDQVVDAISEIDDQAAAENAEAAGGSAQRRRSRTKEQG